MLKQSQMGQLRTHMARFAAQYSNYTLWNSVSHLSMQKLTESLETSTSTTLKNLDHSLDASLWSLTKLSSILKTKIKYCKEVLLARQKRMLPVHTYCGVALKCKTSSSNTFLTELVTNVSFQASLARLEIPRLH